MSKFAKYTHQWDFEGGMRMMYAFSNLHAMKETTRLDGFLVHNLLKIKYERMQINFQTW